MAEWSSKVMVDLDGFFKEGQRESIYEACESDRDRVLIRLLWKSGRRISEILQLKVKEIDFENEDIIWHILKKSKKVLGRDGEKLKYIGKDGVEHFQTKKIDLTVRKAMDNKTLNILKDYIESNQLQIDDYILESPYKPNAHLSRQRCWEIVRDVCIKAGVYKVGGSDPHPHHFRHSYAIDLAKKITTPAGMIVIKDALEHATVAQTEQYLNIGGGELRQYLED